MAAQQPVYANQYQTTQQYQQPAISNDGYYVTQQPQQTNQTVVYATNQYQAAQPVVVVPVANNGYPVSGRQQPTNVVPQYQQRPRNACMKCGELYPLPNGATSWRCRKCGNFNDLAPTCCIVL
eukprot:UN13631